LSDIIAFAIASIALLVIPGPAVIYVLNRSVADGRNTALAGVAGLEIGNFMHVIAATLGLSAIIAASATAFSTVKWAGALYLVFVGIRTLLSKPTPPDARSTSATARKAFTQGIIVNTLNPKVALFSSAISRSSSTRIVDHLHCSPSSSDRSSSLSVAVRMRRMRSPQAPCATAF